MSTQTLGTVNDHNLTAIRAATGGQGVNEMIPGNFANIAQADFATVQQLIKNDKVNGRPTWPYALTENGLLFVPNRGVLQVLPGDVVAVGATGWPILISAAAINTLSPASSWVLT